MRPVRWLFTIPLRLRSLFRSSQADGELDDELRDHVVLKTADYVAKGMAPKEARRRVRLDLEGIEQTKEQCRDARRVNWIQDFVHDLRFAARMLRKSPGFTTVAVLTLAIGIGANTAMFSVVDAVLLRPLPFHDPQKLLNISALDSSGRLYNGPSFSYPDFLDVRERNRTLEGVAVYESNNLVLTGGREPGRVQSVTVSANLFQVLGVQPQLGRGFLQREDDAGPFVVVLSDRFWHSQFNANPNVVGQTVRLNGNACAIVGVMPPGFQYPIRGEGVDLWVSFAPQNMAWRRLPPAVLRDDHVLFAVARLKHGVNLEQANADLASISHALAGEYPSTNTHTAIQASSELEHVVGDTRTPLLILFAAAALVLLITSANVANLLLARATNRAREMAVRIAIGASRSRILRQLVAESLTLSLLGAALGIAAAYGALVGILRLYPSNLPRAEYVRIDLLALLFTAGVAAVAGVLFGLAPALQAARRNPIEAMRAGSVSTTAGAAQNRLRSSLIIAEAALGVALVAGAGLLLRSFERLSNVNLGFNPSHILTGQFNLSEQRYSLEQRERFVGELLSRVRAIPGVTQAAATVPLPLFNDSYFANFDIVERPLPKERQPLSAFYVVTPGFFETLQIPLVSGRLFDERDRRGAAPVLIVSDSFAKNFFPGEDALGKRVAVEIGEAGQGEKERTREVVGIVGDVRHSDLRSAPPPAYYIPLPQLVRSPQTLAIRTSGDPASVFPAIRSTLAAMDPDAALYDVLAMNDMLALDLGLARFQTALLSLIAAIALLLTGVGLYGVVSYIVGQRTHEIGIRRALGAAPAHVLRIVMARGLSLTAAGVCIGIFVSLATAKLLASLLYGISPRDPVSYLLAGIVLIVVALAACYFPARRATRVDPIIALRHE